MTAIPVQTEIQVIVIDIDYKPQFWTPACLCGARRQAQAGSQAIGYNLSSSFLLTLPHDAIISAFMRV